MSFEEFVYEVAEKFYIGKPTDITKDPRFLFRLAILVRAYKTYSILMLLSYPLVQRLKAGGVYDMRWVVHTPSFEPANRWRSERWGEVNVKPT